MSHAHHKARRIRRSGVPHAPLHSAPSLRKDLALGALVGVAMLGIVGLYAATMRYQKAFNQRIDIYPRWTVMDGVIDRVKPIGDKFSQLKDQLVVVVQAKQTQEDATAVLKAKLAAKRADAASGTSETPETP